MQLTQTQEAVLRAVHDAPYIDPAKQNAIVCGAIRDLEALKLLGPSCLQSHCLESTEAGARLLGYA